MKLYMMTMKHKWNLFCLYIKHWLIHVMELMIVPVVSMTLKENPEENPDGRKLDLI
jgi:hypothetical protein